MNALKDLNPPVTYPGPQSAGEYPVVVVRISIPDNTANEPLYPSSNRGAARILSRLLQNRIEAAGIAVKRSDYAFPFNSSWYRFDVGKNRAEPALAMVRAELEILGLLGFAQIAWLDRDGMVWRLHYPESGVFKAPTKAELEAELRLVVEAGEALSRGIKVYGSARN